jgi:hypothetical protein
MLMNPRFGPVSRLSEWLGSLWGMLRMGFSLPLSEGTGSQDEPFDSKQEFHGWLFGDAFATKDPVSRYGERSPGYITGNGLGSLEVGHSDD